jgi:hypothetical protein
MASDHYAPGSKGALLPGPRLRATFPLFQAKRGGVQSLGRPICQLGVASGGRDAPSSGEDSLCLIVVGLDWVFLSVVFVYSLCFSGTICLCSAHFLLEYLLDCC